MQKFENIMLEKDMYQKGENLTDVLEKLDPSENYAGTSLEGLDAFSRQLKRFDIKLSGSGSDCVEKFFKTSNSAILFPEFVRRTVKQGMKNADIVSDIVASTTNINGMDYRSITSVSSDDIIPSTAIRTSENLVKLHKRGRMLVASYEALRFHRLDLFAVTLKQIGAYIAKVQLRDAVDVIINGDGNTNPAKSIKANAGDISYKDILNLWSSMSPYELTTILASTRRMQEILSLSEMQGTNVRISIENNCKIITPLGTTIFHVPNMSDDKIIGLDKNCALEMVQAGDIIVDYEKLIDRQFEHATITCTAGFSKIFAESSKVVEY